MSNDSSSRVSAICDHPAAATTVTTNSGGGDDDDGRAIGLDEGFSNEADVEAENIALIVIFALLVFFVTMTGILVHILCRSSNGSVGDVVSSNYDAPARVGGGRYAGGSTGGTSRSWGSLVSLLILTMIRMEQREQRQMATIDEELII